MTTKKLWIAFICVMVISFAVLGYFGREIYRKAPPIPAQVVTTDGTVLFIGQDIKDGQNVWQSICGQEVGTIWGHGSYVAPDWSADWLHREAVFILDHYAKQNDSMDFKHLPAEKQAMYKVRLQKELRTNTYDETRNVIVISPLRAEAIAAVSMHYAGLFMNDTSLEKLRGYYAIPANSVKTEDRMAKMNTFFFWTAWACVTNRPESDITYTNNWPSEELVNNKPTSSLILWTGFSVIMLLIGIGLLVWYYASYKHEESIEMLNQDPFFGLVMTPSMKATLKYFWVVTGLVLVQVLMGVITAHYGVEGQAFYGLPLSQILPCFAAEEHNWFSFVPRLYCVYQVPGFYRNCCRPHAQDKQ